MPLEQSTATDRVIRPAAVLPERAASDIMGWLARKDVTQGGWWAHDVSYVDRKSAV